MKMIIIFCPFPSNGAPVEWYWQGKTEVLGEKPVPVPLYTPQIPHRLSPIEQEDNIKIDAKEKIDWINLAHDRYKWLAVVNTVMSPQALLRWGEFLIQLSSY
jgi:hypothetical protein